MIEKTLGCSCMGTSSTSHRGISSTWHARATQKAGGGVGGSGGGVGWSGRPDGLAIPSSKFSTLLRGVVLARNTCSAFS
jgi:hypothetical protein